MNESVERQKQTNNGQKWTQFHDNKAENRHHRVVVEMEEGDVLVFLPQDEEDGVEKVDEARDVPQEAERDFAHRGGVVSAAVLDVVELEEAAAEVDAHQALGEEVGVDRRHRAVVHQHHAFQLERTSISHQRRTWSGATKTKIENDCNYKCMHLYGILRIL